MWLFFKILWGFTGLVIPKLFCFLNYLGFYLSWLEDQSSAHQSCVRHGNIVIWIVLAWPKICLGFLLHLVKKPPNKLTGQPSDKQEGPPH